MKYLLPAAAHLNRRAVVALFLFALTVSTLLAACQPVAAPTPAAGGDAAAAGDGGSLVIYSGRSENLVAPIIEQFANESGIEVEVRYGGTSELAATILEEGDNSPADVFFAQDAGALGALSKAGRLDPLPQEILDKVPSDLESRNGDWVGISGRARVLVYNTEELTEADLPDDIWGLTEPKWRGRVGWAPTNGSFQAFVTALRVLEGEERAREWLEAMIANEPQVYENNSAIVAAVAAGEISVGLVNHYYLYRFLAEEGEDFAARNYYFRTPNAGTMINVAGVGIINTSDNKDAAIQFVEFLLSNEAQQYFANETFEYPLAGEGIETPDILVPIDQIATPDIDLSDLDDLEGTLQLLQEVGALQ
ncbi:MAG TPA: iron ABC transporter substrate-binding protein [Caldilineaceae bacterium]|nr:iron ABC transporter substrate-binding protein [Caldilineaceae bacterium]